MDMQDRRVRRTQKALARALISLTLEKGYEAITIRDITDRAEIGYATFFRHYHDKDALLKDVLDVVLDELTSLLSAPMSEANHETIGTLIFRYAQEHSEVVLVLLSSRASADLGHDRVGTEHMLLGLIRTDGSPAARILRDLGFTPDELRESVQAGIARRSTTPGRR